MKPFIGAAEERIVLADEAERRQLHQRTRGHVGEVAAGRGSVDGEDGAACALGAIEDTIAVDRGLELCRFERQRSRLFRTVLEYRDFREIAARFACQTVVVDRERLADIFVLRILK